MVETEPIDAPVWTSAGMISKSASVCNLPLWLTADEYLSFMKVTSCPMNILSSIVTPSHINGCEDIFTSLPSFTSEATF